MAVSLSTFRRSALSCKSTRRQTPFRPISVRRPRLTAKGAASRLSHARRRRIFMGLAEMCGYKCRRQKWATKSASAGLAPHNLQHPAIVSLCQKRFQKRDVTVGKRLRQVNPVSRNLVIFIDYPALVPPEPLSGAAVLTDFQLY